MHRALVNVRPPFKSITTATTTRWVFQKMQRSSSSASVRMPQQVATSTTSTTSGFDNRIAGTTSTTRPFSSSMAASSTTTKQRPTRKAPITVTERAAARIQEILVAQTKDPVGIRLGVKRRGCNGYSYTLNYVHSPTEFPKDEIVQASDQVTIFIDPMALFSIVGTTMDWVDTELSSEFTFENPNSKGECGCGESFTV